MLGVGNGSPCGGIRTARSVQRWIDEYGLRTRQGDSSIDVQPPEEFHGEQEMNVKNWAVLALLAGAPALGCFPIETENPGREPLTHNEARRVLKCQETIKDRGRIFVTKKMRALETCFDEVLEVLIPYENGLIGEEQAYRGFDRATRRCRGNFVAVKHASRRLVDGIETYC